MLCDLAGQSQGDGVLAGRSTLRQDGNQLLVICLMGQLVP